MQGICKLYNILPEEQDIKEIKKLVEQNYPKSVDITLKELVEWGKSDQMEPFFEIPPYKS